MDNCILQQCAGVVGVYLSALIGGAIGAWRMDRYYDRTGCGPYDVPRRVFFTPVVLAMFLWFIVFVVWVAVK